MKTYKIYTPQGIYYGKGKTLLQACMSTGEPANTFKSIIKYETSNVLQRTD